MNFAVLQFPASNCDQDAVHALRLLGHKAELRWHKEQSLGSADAVIVPGGTPRQDPVSLASKGHSTNRESSAEGPGLSLVIRHSFVIRHWDFVIGQPVHRPIRAGSPWPRIH